MSQLITWRRVIVLLVIFLLLIFVEKRAYEFLRRKHQPTLSPTPSPTVSASTEAPKKTLFSQVQNSLQRVMRPASERSAEEKANASKEFGAALERAGIETQAEAAHPAALP